MKKISYKKLYSIINTIIIDVRDIEEYNSFHLNNTINIPYFDLINNNENYLLKSFTYYIICKTGYRSKLVCKKLNKHGYNLIYVIKGIDSIIPS